MFSFNEMSFLLHYEDAQRFETLTHCKGSSLYVTDFTRRISTHEAYQFPKMPQSRSNKIKKGYKEERKENKVRSKEESAVKLHDYRTHYTTQGK